MIAQDRLRVSVIAEVPPPAEPVRFCGPFPDTTGDDRSVAIDAGTMTKTELACVLYEQLGLNKRESKEMVEAFFEIITRALSESGQDVLLSGFGSFRIRHKASRPARNPRTGEVVPVSERRVVTFHASRKLREAVDINSPL